MADNEYAFPLETLDLPFESEDQQRDMAKREINNDINEKSSKLSSKTMLSLQEGDIVCLNAFYNNSIESIFTSYIIAYVEKCNSSKTKLQVRIHQVSDSPRDNIYENISFSKGDLSGSAFLWLTAKSIGASANSDIFYLLINYK